MYVEHLDEFIHSYMYLHDDIYIKYTFERKIWIFYDSNKLINFTALRENNILLK